MKVRYTLPALADLDYVSERSPQGASQPANLESLLPTRTKHDIVVTMERAQALERLQAHAAAVRAMGATALYLFGSTIRDEATSESDLDLFIDYDAGSRFNAFDLVGIKLFLEEKLETKVDLVIRDGLHPRLRQAIERTAVRVF